MNDTFFDNTFLSDAEFEEFINTENTDDIDIDKTDLSDIVYIEDYNAESSLYFMNSDEKIIIEIDIENDLKKIEDEYKNLFKEFLNEF